MNVSDRKTFERVLYLLDTEEIKTTDTETTGLNIYKGDRLFSLSLYFPRVNESYNLSFRAGTGEVDINYTDKTTEDIDYDDMKWGTTKKSAYLAYWWQKYRVGRNFGNLPLVWLDELKSHWGKGRWILHNAKFDQTVLKLEGFPDMEIVEDTLLALHLVNEDFRRVQVEAPFLWTEKDSKPVLNDKKEITTPAKCTKADVGKWARGTDGNLLKKTQNANRRLKWFSAYLGLPNATVGEEGLAQAITEFETELVDFICQYPLDPMNDFALSKGTKKDPTRKLSKAKIAAKVSIDDKAHMWMLKSLKTAYYAELDTILTWHLREWCLTAIRDWHNEKLYEEVCQIQQFAIFPMEFHGIRLDKEAAQNEIERLAPRITELEHILAKVAGEWGFKKFGIDDIENVDLTEDEEDDKLFNLASPPQLLSLLNSGALAVDYGTSLFPEWFPSDMRAELKTYDNVFLEKTNKEALDEVKDHPIVRILRFYRLMKKSCDTYLRNWLKAADANGYMHPNFHVDGTVSGRMSSGGGDVGNFQNIPTRGYYRIAAAVIAPKGHKIVAFDYRTLEMGIAAAIAEGMLGLDKNKPLLTELRKANADVHTRTVNLIGIRSLVFGDMTDDEILLHKGYNLNHPDFDTPKKRAKRVAKEIRQIAKTLNFGLLYNGTAKMVRRLLGVSLEVAELLVQKWRAIYPAYALAQEYYTKLALTRRPTPSNHGTGMYVTQPYSGRHRKLHKYPTKMGFTKYGRYQTFNPQEAGAKKTWNNIVQGLGGYFCTMALLRYYQKYGYGHLIAFAQIHDALEVYVKDGSEEHIKYLAECMVDFDIDPGLRVDIAVSKSGNWQDMNSLVEDFTYGKGDTWDNPEFVEAYENWCLTKGQE